MVISIKKGAPIENHKITIYTIILEVQGKDTLIEQVLIVVPYSKNDTSLYDKIPALEKIFKPNDI
jgi:hypothetical protein